MNKYILFSLTILTTIQFIKFSNHYFLFKDAMCTYTQQIFESDFRRGYFNVLTIDGEQFYTIKNNDYLMFHYQVGSTYKCQINILGSYLFPYKNENQQFQLYVERYEYDLKRLYMKFLLYYNISLLYYLLFF